MGTTVQTVSTCDRCDRQAKRAGVEGGLPPADWSELVITLRLEGAGWENRERRVACLCPDCALDIHAVLDNLPARPVGG